MTPERRAAMGQAAVAAAQAVGYVGAGTVEFIAEPSGRFYFMEMNTRLQVEHPVTEAITGQDLVEWQLRVAAGEPLPLSQDQLRLQGHAIEARVYAENPEKDFLPSIGRLDVLQWPAHVGFQIGPVRVDGGVREGDTITPYYDPMIAKLIVHGQDREQARRRMQHALGAVRATGLHTNIAFLGRLMDDPAFVAADLDTGLIPREHDRLFPVAAATPDAVLALAAAAVLHQSGLSGSDRLPASALGRADGVHAAPPPSSPWQLADGWRVGGRYERTLPLRDAQSDHVARLRRQGADWSLAISDGGFQPFHWQAEGHHPCRLRVRLDGAETRAEAYLRNGRLDLFTGGQRHTLDWQDPIALATGQAEDTNGGLSAPMPGKILSVAVATGDTVSKGQPLVVMEAMKMEHTIEAPHDGTVQEIFYAVGDQVPEGATLIALDESGH
ncbi:3-methylcrotonyl-CoA carboxylase alpha subunit OS=Castellaniella defragrans OX=75697 GN=HNR28_002200 PE=4 SV=1 [Castellaniella defragrans]